MFNTQRHYHNIEVLLYSLFFIVASAVTLGTSLCYLWLFFAVPLGAPAIPSIVHGAGLILMIRMVFIPSALVPKGAIDITNNERVKASWERFKHTFSVALQMLLLGYLLSLFI